MATKTENGDRTPTREILVVCAITLLGAIVRLWGLGRVGLVHFDEGVYAFAGLWGLSPDGLRGIDPGTIAYAPPGFPILVGLSYQLLGVADVSAVLVSVLLGTLAIPVSAWVARRTFGVGAGGAAAALAAFSGLHISCSRMALVDAGFTLFVLIAIGFGQRFLERPGASRAVVLGIAVGLAQLFKYNGWISGAVVAVAATAWPLRERDELGRRAFMATWAWGALAATVAAAVYWPWFRFVESHGGYAKLLAHQRGYLGGFADWPGHLDLQLDQAGALSGGLIWRACGSTLAAIAMVAVADRSREFLWRKALLIAGMGALGAISEIAWWTSALWLSTAIFWRKMISGPAQYVLLVAWVAFAILTPFYHPYARLWLPVHALGWLIMAGAFAAWNSTVEIAGRGRRWGFGMASDPLPGFVILGALVTAARFLEAPNNRSGPAASLWEASDSVRSGCHQIREQVPRNVKGLRIYARRPVAFYLALEGGVPVFTQPDLAHLLVPAAPDTWALLDMAMVRQDHVTDAELSQLVTGWEEVGEVSTTLNRVTLLDIEPEVVRGAPWNSSASLRLFRPARAGGRP
jgi:4-amino-4-deoxy-L-arabinose transferase-like glycosyltransferase